MNGRGYFRSYFQICDEGQYERGDDAECKVTENNRQNPCERPRIMRIMLRSEPPHNYRGDQSRKRGDIPAQSGDLQRLFTFRAN